MATALTRRQTSSSNGSATYSWASIAIDQKARFGLGTVTTSCSSRPLTTTELPFGTGHPGWATTNHVIARLNRSAAQYAGRMRQARRRAKRESPSSRHPFRAGAMASEKPESTMKTTTAKRP